jgi:hypothetical protein
LPILPILVLVLYIELGLIITRISIIRFGYHSIIPSLVCWYGRENFFCLTIGWGEIAQTFAQKHCNNVLTNDYVFTVDKFTKEKSIQKLDKRVATSGASCSDFNYDLVSTLNGDS